MSEHLFIEFKKKKYFIWDILKYNSLMIWDIENSKEVKFKR